MSFKKRLTAGIAAAVASIVIGASAASADVCAYCNGGIVANWTSSSGPIVIYNGIQSKYLYPGQYSSAMTMWKDVDKFYLPKCAAQHYNTSTGLWGTVFKAKTWYSITDSTALSLRVAWC